MTPEEYVKAKCLVGQLHKLISSHTSSHPHLLAHGAPRVAARQDVSAPQTTKPVRWRFSLPMTMHHRPSPRDWLIGILPGSGIGAVVLGIGGRVAMRGIALLSGAASGFSFGGTATVILLGALSGLAGAIVFVGLCWLLPRQRVARVLLFWLFLVLVTLRGLRPVDLQRLALFMPLVLTYGLILHVTWCRATRRRHVRASAPLVAAA